MRSMIGRLEKYMERKGLEVNVGKTKIMRFKREGGKESGGREEGRWRR